MFVLILFIYFMCKNLYIYTYMDNMVYVWKSGGNLLESILYFYHVDPRNWTHVFWPGSKLTNAFCKPRLNNQLIKEN